MARSALMILAIVATCTSACMAAVVVFMVGGTLLDVYSSVLLSDWSSLSDLIMLLLLYAPLPLWLTFILARFAK